MITFGKIKIKSSLINILVLCALAVFGVTVIGPKRNYLNQLKISFQNTQSEIFSIESSFAQNQSLQDGIKSFEAKMRAVDSKFPAKEEESLGLVSDLARKHKIEVASVKSSPKAFFLDESQQQVIVEGKVCQRILVSVEMKSTYQGLLGYIKDLKEALPAYVTVENLRINKDVSATSPVLRVSLDINLYLLS